MSRTGGFLVDRQVGPISIVWWFIFYLADFLPGLIQSTKLDMMFVSGDYKRSDFGQFLLNCIIPSKYLPSYRLVAFEDDLYEHALFQLSLVSYTL